MKSIASILLHLDAAPHSRERLALACRLARRLDAGLLALYGAAPSATSLVPLPMGGGGLTMEDVQRDEQRRAQARAWFEEAAAAGQPKLNWSELRAAAPVAEGFAREALLHDLIVIGQQDAEADDNAGLPDDFAEEVVIDSGRPALLVPFAGRFQDVGQRVLVAWKPSREAARALSAALALLQPGAQVHVVSWGSDPTELRPLLQHHGIEAEFHAEGGDDGQVGELLLSRAADFGADLLVMGCYGRSRTRERLLGGASRSVFSAMTVPVLMSH
ncbi:universal stress protein [Azohydromonas caseinilytica]|uniref:Universal stress protein n=1 Tax=Azohydromonas caseinilytica TaxID=2728836 RepID=A0A848F706_9BURK|nr:universal stress protein [Azohydromonas caseinilytica]NML14516.1 universal stress protein [Azohydromonas caseinilytica]